MFVNRRSLGLDDWALQVMGEIPNGADQTQALQIFRGLKAPEAVQVEEILKRWEAEKR